jgi:hypothetical protein
MLRVFPHLSSSLGYITPALVLSLSRLVCFNCSTPLNASTHSLVFQSFSYSLRCLSQTRETFFPLAKITCVLEIENSIVIPTLHHAHYNYYITPWPWSASELCRPSDRRLLAELVATFADRRCRVVSAADAYGLNVGSLDRRRYIFSSISSIVLTRLSGSRSRSTTS